MFDSPRKLDGQDQINTNNIQNIWVMNADGTSPTPLTTYTFSSSFRTVVAFSPHRSPVMIGGQFQIVFASFGDLNGNNSANTNDIFNIWVMNADGTNAIPLTTFMCREAIIRCGSHNLGSFSATSFLRFTMRYDPGHGSPTERPDMLSRVGA
ncbi:MAG: hypothetical protein WB952_12305 [Terriglobales bacterium]